MPVSELLKCHVAGTRTCIARATSVRRVLGGSKELNAHGSMCDFYFQIFIFAMAAGKLFAAGCFRVQQAVRVSN